MLCYGDWVLLSLPNTTLVVCLVGSIALTPAAVALPVAIALALRHQLLVLRALHLPYDFVCLESGLVRIHCSNVSALRLVPKLGRFRGNGAKFTMRPKHCSSHAKSQEASQCAFTRCHNERLTRRGSVATLQNRAGGPRSVALR